MKHKALMEFYFIFIHQIGNKWKRLITSSTSKDNQGGRELSFTANGHVYHHHLSGKQYGDIHYNLKVEIHFESAISGWEIFCTYL